MSALPVQDAVFTVFCPGPDEKRIFSWVAAIELGEDGIFEVFARHDAEMPKVLEAMEWVNQQDHQPNIRLYVYCQLTDPCWDFDFLHRKRVPITATNRVAKTPAISDVDMCLKPDACELERN